MWTVPRMWEQETCIIIGGGASIPRQFGVPEMVIDEVLKGQRGPDAYSPYMESIHGCHVIAINIAFKIGPWMDCLFFGDSGFFSKYTDQIFAWKGLRVTCGESMGDYSGKIKVLGRDRAKHGICFNPNTVCWNFNSGGAAINFAVHTGVNRIILLGYDMKLDEQKNQHFHNYYHGNVKTVGATMAMHMKGFPVIAEALKDKVEIINASPDSALTCFPKMPFKEIKL